MKINSYKEIINNLETMLESVEYSMERQVGGIAQSSDDAYKLIVLIKHYKEVVAELEAPVATTVSKAPAKKAAAVKKEG